MKKLEIELVPASMWKCNLREFLTSKSWDLVRRASYLKANNSCEICGGKGVFGRGHPVECHEIWEFNDLTKVQKLKGVTALCTICHRTKHFGLSSLRGWTDQCKNQLKKVNNWNTMEVVSHINMSFSLFERRKNEEWNMDLNWLKEIQSQIVFKPKYKHLEIFIKD